LQHHRSVAIGLLAHFEHGELRLGRKRELAALEKRQRRGGVPRRADLSSGLDLHYGRCRPPYLHVGSGDLGLALEL
jgi:hypothetical protein